jgi:hypothetical protein
MHWTAFLAYRRFPENARVIDDLACIGCGYNLRLQMVRARCPECGLEVGNSIFLLAKPAETARSLRAAAPTFCAPLIFVLTCLNGAHWALLVASAVLAAAGVFRVWAVSELRFRAALARLPVLGTRLHLWWMAVVAEMAISIIWCAAIVIIASSLTLRLGPGGAMIQRWCILAWWCAAMLGTFLAGRFGYALMDMLGYSWTRIEFRAQQISVLVGIAAFPLLLMAVQLVSSPVMVYVMLLAMLLVTIGPHVQTSIALLHAATAAETSSESWEDVLDSQRVTLVPQTTLPGKPEPPPIRVE